MIRATINVVGATCFFLAIFLLIVHSRVPQFPPDSPADGDLIVFAPPGTIGRRILARTKSAKAIRQSEAAEIVFGNITVVCPENFTMGIPQEVKLLVSQDDIRHFLTSAERRIAAVEADRPISSTLEVTLKGSKDLSIVERRSSRQGINDRLYQTWTWDVTPEWRGQHRLYFSVTAIVTLDGKEHRVDSYNEPKTISASLNFLYWLNQMVHSKPDWMWSLIVAFIAWIAGGFAERRKARRAKTMPEVERTRTSDQTVPPTSPE